LSRNPIWPLYGVVRIADILARWTVRADKERKYQQSRRRRTDVLYGRRASDVTSPRGLHSLHIHWLPALLLGGLGALILHWLWVGATISR
jgi:hypothetical protein